MVICPECEKDVKDAKFCSNCGALLQKAEKVVVEVKDNTIDAKFKENPEEETVVDEPVAADIPDEVAEEVVEETVDEDAPPAEGMVRSYFTNQWVDEEVNNTRPIAVMYPINKEAQPQYGLSNVAVFYEIMEEGSMSRQMGVLEDWQKLERIGNILWIVGIRRIIDTILLI